MKNINWWVWERPGAIHLLHKGVLGAMYPLKQNFGGCYASMLYTFYRRGFIRAGCDLDEMINYGKKMLPDFLDDDNFKIIMGKWRSKEDELKLLIKKLSELNFIDLDDSELLKLYKEHDKLHAEWWAITQIIEPITFTAELILKKKLNAEQHKLYFNTLVTTTKSSYTTEEEAEILKITKLAKENGIDDEEVKTLLVNHSEKYYWVMNGFFETSKLGIDYFRGVVKKHIEDHVDVTSLNRFEERLQKLKKDKEDIMLKLDFDEQTKKLVWLIDEFGYVQDCRKAVALESNFYLDESCKEVARRKNISYDLLRYAFPKQIVSILNGGDVPIDLLKKQSDYCALIYRDDDPDVEILLGKAAEKKERDVFGVTQDGGVSEIEGMCANQGRAIGKVRVLMNPKECDKLQQGEILVATMTSPDFVVAMKKAGAIVTDEGGITSHAAVVSRELGIPCVIGTKVATRVLKDGMNVEVKANHGLIKIIGD